jgi:Ca2+-binding RTX toxin-like protein
MADIDGTTGDDILVGTPGGDLIRGLEGNDVLDGAGGVDRLEGGIGNDVYFADGDDLVIEAAGEGYDTIYAKASFTLGAGQEVEVLDSFDRTQTIALSLTGNALSQALIGNAGNNILDGAGGTDVFHGLGGDDTYIVDSTDDLVIEYAGQGLDKVLATASYALAAGQAIERLEAFDQAGTSALNLTGNALAQTITGNAGVNVLDGAGGLDVLNGLGGNDVYFVDGDDVVNEAVGEGYDTVYARATFILAAGQEVEVLDAFNRTATAALNLTGNAFSQTLIGNAGNNVLDGDGGADIMYGLNGNDTYFIDNAAD